MHLILATKLWYRTQANSYYNGDCESVPTLVGAGRDEPLEREIPWAGMVPGSDGVGSPMPRGLVGA